MSCLLALKAVCVWDGPFAARARNGPGNPVPDQTAASEFILAPSAGKIMTHVKKREKLLRNLKNLPAGWGVNSVFQRGRITGEHEVRPYIVRVGANRGTFGVLAKSHPYIVWVGANRGTFGVLAKSHPYIVWVGANLVFARFPRTPPCKVHRLLLLDLSILSLSRNNPLTKGNSYIQHINEC
jgi:hypothetical protein